MTDKEVARALKSTHKDLKLALNDVDKRKRDFLNVLIIARNRESWTFQEIADVLGISAPRVHQLMKQADQL